MTAFDQLFTTLSYSLWFVILILVATWEKPVDHTTGLVFCHSAQVTIIFGVFYSFMAGAGTAFMRLKYITYSSRYGEKALAVGIVAFTIAVVLLLTLVYDLAPKRSQTMVSMCKGTDFFMFLLHFQPEYFCVKYVNIDVDNHFFQANLKNCI